QAEPVLYEIAMLAFLAFQYNRSMKAGTSDRIREYARREYIDPARKRGELRVQIVAGEVHRALGLKNRSPQVSNALSNHKFLDENRLVLEKSEGPAGGMSTTMRFTYRILVSDAATTGSSADPLTQLYGIAKGMGLEAEVRFDREHFYDRAKDPMERR